MAQDELNKDTATKKKVSTKDKEKTKSREKPPSKVIIRRLPPTMTEEVFLEQISPLPENDFFSFVKGEQHFGVPTFSRAYINFLNLEEIFTFQDKFDGYVFLDQKGTEYPAVVEFAPYQRIPRHLEPGAKEDKCNTIDNDPHYLQFLKKLEQPEEIVLPSAESYLEQLELREREIKANGHVKITTPLVEFIHQRRIDREKFREEKKDERRRKEFEKKKQRELERISKKREGKKDDKKQDKLIQKGKKEDDRPPNPVKVLKNTERENLEKSDKAEAGASNKTIKEVSRTKSDKPKERLAREKPKPKPERRQAAESGDSNKSEMKQETQQSHQQPKKSVSNKEETFSSSENPTGAVSSKQEEDKGARKRTENDSAEKDKKIRNKDRPAIQIYRPGAKRMTGQKSDDTSTTVASTSTEGVKREVKTRTFSRSTSAAKE
nr:EOG090X04G9 [Ceriodaphnia reticulata]